MAVKLSFELEPITPLFSAGPDPREPEIRPPSIRGVLRFWFRAMLGGVLSGHGPDMANTVRRLESEAFGKASSPSTVDVCVRETKLDIRRAGGRLRIDQPGLIYLGFPFFSWAGRGEYELKRGYVAPDSSSFRLEIGLPDDETTQKAVVGALWLMLHFGGLGSRSRRGFGSLASTSPKEARDVTFHPSTGQGLAEYFQRNLQAIEASFKAFCQARGADSGKSIFEAEDRPRPDFPSFAKWEAVLVTSGRWGKWETVLDDVGKFLRLFRNESTDDLRARTPDYLGVVSPYLPHPSEGSGGAWEPGTGAGGRPDLRNDVFGLPLQFRSFSRSQRATEQFGKARTDRAGQPLYDRDGRPRRERLDISAGVKWRMPGDSDDHDRRASPLIIRPLRLDSSYSVVFLVLESEFLPAEAVEQLMPMGKWPPSDKVPRPRTQGLVPADFGPLYEFLQQAERHPGFQVLGHLP